MDRLQKILLVAAAAVFVALGSSFVDAGTDRERPVTAAGGVVGTAPVPDELDTESLRASHRTAVSSAQPQSIARHFLDADAGSGAPGDASADGNGPEEAGIPGAIVAVIFGIFGLLVIARRSSTR